MAAMQPIVIARYPSILLFIFFETIKGAAKTVPNKTLIICKIVIEFKSVPKKISHYLTFFLKVNTFFSDFIYLKIKNILLRIFKNIDSVKKVLIDLNRLSLFNMNYRSSYSWDGSK